VDEGAALGVADDDEATVVVSPETAETAMLGSAGKASNGSTPGATALTLG
jgi:hypothetical protein